jgi:hypothetical protein
MTAEVVKMDQTRWSATGEPLVQVKGPGGSRVIRKSQLADYENRGFEVERYLANEPFDAGKPEPVAKEKAKKAKKDK